MTRQYQTLLLERRENIAVLTLNRPQKLNALDLLMARELIQVCDELEEDDSVRVVVMTGAGRAFCAGGDVDDFMVRMAERPVKEKERAVRLPDLTSVRLKMFEKPTIAAVNGVAVGGGCCLAMACDIRLVAEDARFGLVFILRGLSGADMGASWLLPRLVGSGWAYELLYTGDLIDARTAERIGLVNRVVPRDQLMAEAMSLAEKLASRPPIGLRMTKRALNRSWMQGMAEHLDFEAALQSFCFMTEDHQEGWRSFKEKREPLFRGQ